LLNSKNEYILLERWKNFVSSYLDSNNSGMLKTIFFSEKQLALKSEKEAIEGRRETDTPLNLSEPQPKLKRQPKRADTRLAIPKPNQNHQN